MLFPAIFFIKSDHLLFSVSASFYRLLAARLTYIAVSLIIVFVVLKTRKVAVFDYALLTFLLSLCGIIIFVNLSRPPRYVNHSIIDILIVMLMYLAAPARLQHRALSAL